MEPDRVGRKLGVGMRVASGMLRDRAAQTAQTVRQDAPAYAQHGQTAVTGVKTAIAGAKTGTKRFGEAVWGPFVHAGAVLWLEITGLFFALFGLFFAQGVYRLRADWRSGPNHERLLAYAAVALIFFYFSVTSFYRARRKQLRRKAQTRND
jgi:hypothetical protein